MKNTTQDKEQNARVFLLQQISSPFYGIFIGRESLQFQNVLTPTFVLVITCEFLPSEYRHWAKLKSQSANQWVSR